MRLSAVCDESKACPMSGNATFATARLRLATAATRINAVSTSPCRAGAPGRPPADPPITGIITPASGFAGRHHHRELPAPSAGAPPRLGPGEVCILLRDGAVLAGVRQV